MYTLRLEDQFHYQLPNSILDLSLSPIEIFFELEYKIGSWCFEFENAIRSSLGLIFENLIGC